MDDSNISNEWTPELRAKWEHVPQRCPGCGAEPGNCDACSSCGLELFCCQAPQGTFLARTEWEGAERVLVQAVNHQSTANRIVFDLSIGPFSPGWAAHQPDDDPDVLAAVAALPLEDVIGVLRAAAGTVGRVVRGRARLEGEDPWVTWQHICREMSHEGGS